MLGNVVNNLVSSKVLVIMRHYDATNDQGQNVSGGVYFYVLKQMSLKTKRCYY